MRYILLILLATHAFGSEGMRMYLGFGPFFGGSSSVSGIGCGSSLVPGVSGVLGRGFNRAVHVVDSAGTVGCKISNAAEHMNRTVIRKRFDILIGSEKFHIQAASYAQNAVDYILDRNESIG